MYQFTDFHSWLLKYFSLPHVHEVLVHMIACVCTYVCMYIHMYVRMCVLCVLCVLVWVHVLYYLYTYAYVLLGVGAYVRTYVYV